MDGERKEKVSSLFTDCWKFFKEFYFTAEEWQRGKDKGRWDRIAERAKQINQQYGEEAMGMVLATMELIENSEKEALRGISQYRLDPPIYG